MNYDLPTSIEIGGKVYNIRNRGDWRVILDVIAALTDAELDERERAAAALCIFYEELPTDVQTAADEMVKFIDGEERESRAAPDGLGAGLSADCRAD